ncbi:FRG domain-containing protein [Synoicihabitans lomoniglobus]|uniref:FRG domain-containing protein n=1 Tax=Synoicihabitans lomoniglobus TaxID=2909285 RepID=UPI0031F307DB
MAPIADFLTKTLAEFLAHAEQPLSFLYRGVSRPEYDLIPGVAREWKEGALPLTSIEKTMFADFKRRAIAHLRSEPKNEWEWLMLAQHHGMPTRLLRAQKGSGLNNCNLGRY